jgi:hypothetical protein
MVYLWRGTKFCQGVFCFENGIDFYYSQYHIAFLNISSTTEFYPKFDVKYRNCNKIEITTLSVTWFSWICSHETRVAYRQSCIANLSQNDKEQSKVGYTFIYSRNCSVAFEADCNWISASLTTSCKEFYTKIYWKSDHLLADTLQTEGQTGWWMDVASIYRCVNRSFLFRKERLTSSNWKSRTLVPWR